MTKGIEFYKGKFRNIQLMDLFAVKVKLHAYMPSWYTYVYKNILQLYLIWSSNPRIFIQSGLSLFPMSYGAERTFYAGREK